MLPFIIVRDETKGYGTGNRIEGPFEHGDTPRSGPADVLRGVVGVVPRVGVGVGHERLGLVVLGPLAAGLAGAGASGRREGNHGERVARAGRRWEG